MQPDELIRQCCEKHGVTAEQLVLALLATLKEGHYSIHLQSASPEPPDELPDFSRIRDAYDRQPVSMADTIALLLHLRASRNMKDAATAFDAYADVDSGVKPFQTAGAAGEAFADLIEQAMQDWQQQAEKGRETIRKTRSDRPSDETG